jgi:hypothetical protein
LFGIVGRETLKTKHDHCTMNSSWENFGKEREEATEIVSFKIFF